MKIENIPKAINGKKVDRWFCLEYSRRSFWQKREYAVDFLLSEGFNVQ
jgi:hypothetical protein